MHVGAPRLNYDLGRLAKCFRTSQMSSQWYVHDREPRPITYPTVLMFC